MSRKNQTNFHVPFFDDEMYGNREPTREDDEFHEETSYSTDSYNPYYSPFGEARKRFWSIKND